MATDESDFTTGFRKDLRKHYPDAEVWTNNDMFKVGLPDFSVSWRSRLYAVEAKFITILPKRRTSQCLKHEVSAKQVEFLLRIRETGNHAAVLIGLKDIAVVMREIKTNYTLEEVLKAHRIPRVGGAWDVNSFLETVGRFSERE